MIRLFCKGKNWGKRVVGTTALVVLIGQYIFAQELKNEEIARNTSIASIEENKAKPTPTSFVELTSASEASVKGGLKWLAVHQNPDGSFGKEYPVAITSLAGLTFMASGSLPDRGKYKENIRKALEYVLAHQGASGFINEANGKKMHSHGYATLFLAELYGMVSRESVTGLDLEDLKWRLKKAVNMIESCQSQSGGWFYYPAPSGDENSVTVTVVGALRSARNAGIKVSPEVINKALSYVKSCANSDGGISYSLSDRTATFALTSAGISVLDYLGEYKGKEVQAGLEYLKRAYDDQTPAGKGTYNYYEDFYAALAFWNSGSENWMLYFPRIRNDVIQSQKPEGFWECAYGDEYATALATLILQIPCRILPIFQR